MGKKGVSLVPTLLVVFAIALVVLVLVLVLTGRGFFKFRGGEEQTQEEFYKCFCTSPGKTNTCAPAVDGKPPEGFKEPAKKLSAGWSEWEDCNLECWEKK